jgi:hypothetical protein
VRERSLTSSGHEGDGQRPSAKPAVNGREDVDVFYTQSCYGDDASSPKVLDNLAGQGFLHTIGDRSTCSTRILSDSDDLGISI